MMASLGIGMHALSSSMSTKIAQSPYEPIACTQKLTKGAVRSGISAREPTGRVGDQAGGRVAGNPFASSQGLPQDRRSCCRRFVQTPNGRRIWRVARRLRRRSRLGQDLLDDLGKRLERLPSLGLGRLDQQALVDQLREVDRWRVDTEVEHPLG